MGENRRGTGDRMRKGEKGSEEKKGQYQIERGMGEGEGE